MGSASNAADYVSLTKYITHTIATTFDEADDIATAIRDLKEFDIDKEGPTLLKSEKDKTNDPEGFDHESK